MKAPINIDEYVKRLPLDRTELEKEQLPQAFIERLERLRGIYTYWLQFPNKQTQEIVKYDLDMFLIGKTQAYEDIQLVKVLIGDLQSTTKDFWRWRINTMILEDHEQALKDKDWRSVASMQKNLILNNKTNKEDPLELDFEKIVPQQFEMTDDIAIVIPGKHKTSRKKIEDMLKKYGRKDEMQIEDADFEEVNNDDEQ